MLPTPLPGSIWDRFVLFAPRFTRLFHGCPSDFAAKTELVMRKKYPEKAVMKRAVKDFSPGPSRQVSIKSRAGLWHYRDAMVFPAGGGGTHLKKKLVFSPVFHFI